MKFARVIPSIDESIPPPGAVVIKPHMLHDGTILWRAHTTASFCAHNHGLKRRGVRVNDDIIFEINGKLFQAYDPGVVFAALMDVFNVADYDKICIHLHLDRV
jgi:hypothetical protein